jgi:adhesin transport system outer membrane protein
VNPVDSDTALTTEQKAGDPGQIQSATSPRVSEAEITSPSASQPAPLDSSEISELLTAWARSWSKKQVDDYLAFYSREFRPSQGSSREEWASGRRQRLLKPGNILVTLAEIEIQELGSGRAEATLVQSYISESYSDRVRKTLELSREETGWKIVKEEVQPD